jgi:hypothetical protein
MNPPTSVQSIAEQAIVKRTRTLFSQLQKLLDKVLAGKEDGDVAALEERLVS